MNVTDFFLSKEEFQLLKCTDCKLIATSPRPSADIIGDYYKSTDYVSHSSTKKGIVNRLYAIVRNHTLKQKVKLIRRLTTGKELLDIGAGTGHFVAKAQAAGFIVNGLEPDADARRVAKNEHNIELSDLNQLVSLPKSTYDAITLWHVLEHVYNLQEDLTTISSLLKGNGVLIVAVPNCSSYDAAHYEKFWAAYDVPRHLYHFTPESIIPLVESKGVKFEKMLPMKFDSYYVSMLSEKYKGGGIVSGFWNGWKSNIKAGNGKYSSQIYIFRK